MTLREYIEREIGERGPIPFSRYMELCLYGAPGGDPPGFYSRAREQFGKAGDFYTSSDVHAVFGRLLARQFDEMWRVLGSPPRIDLVELGPGRGLFAQDVLDWTAKKFPEFHRALHVTLVEASPGLRARLDERFAAQIAAGKVQVVERIEAAKIETEFIVFANEFFDALPVEVIADRGELRIGVEKGRFVESFAPPSAAELDFLDRYSVHPEPGERVEATLVALDHLRRIAAAPAAGARGFCLLVDYGYTRQEQLAGRHCDTVMAFRQHTISQNPYEAPGEQDITAHVNFTALMEVGKQVGLEPLALVTQSQLLMGIGEDNQFADAFEDCRLPQERAKVALQLKHLATPVGMGDAFQALVLGRGVVKEKARGLSGLKFARNVPDF
jgi:SAM-dependent MidA family methyltransferase